MTAYAWPRPTVLLRKISNGGPGESSMRAMWQWRHVLSVGLLIGSASLARWSIVRLPMQR